ncbi:MAG: flagellar biosynthesis protein FlhF [Burkholderiales bacterium RIFCSPHIGHO2_12_FULL_69_20]|nr:MAG: flagellar biosynthesis protein FlhF [Burkholderiales bacterium RIFCSPHIGHO2_12_FULL_69_20]
MNVKRFTAKTAREALALVREALGDDAVVLSTKPSGDGVEVLALAPEGMARIQQAAAQAPVQRAAPPVVVPAPPTLTRPATLAERIAARGERFDARVEPRLEPTLGDSAPSRFDPSRSAAMPEPGFDQSVARDVETLGMSTLTFQDYVRERMLKRRQAELAQQAPSLPAALAARATAPQAATAAPATAQPLRVVASEGRRADAAPPERHAALRERINAKAASTAPRREPPVLRDEIRLAGPGQHDVLGDSTSLRERGEAMGELRGELRSVRALIDERFGMLAFMERLQRDPRQAGLSQKLFDAGLSPALVRKLVQSLPDAQQAPDELAWAAGVLERNLHTDEHELPLEDHDGVLALIGPTGVGKTTSTAKLAAAFATKHGAANLGLITLDAYRVAAHEQLRTYGRILGVPVHTAHDRASLEDLLELLSAKKLVLIDTAGMAQRDARTKELLDMLQHRSIKKLLVINAAAQGETVEDVMVAYGVPQCHGVIVSKLDEAVKLGPALDALIRHRARVVGVANGQRVPEDWHRLSAQSLVQRALRGGGSAS